LFYADIRYGYIVLCRYWVWLYCSMQILVMVILHWKQCQSLD